MHILLIENNHLDQSESLLSALKEQGYQVDVAHNAQQATETVETQWPNLIVFHRTHHYLDQSDLREKINEINLNIPYVIMSNENHSTTETTEERDFIPLGEICELIQTIEKISVNQKNRFIRFPGLTVDSQQRQVLRDQKIYSLTPKEAKLLRLLVNNPDQILSRQKIMREVWETTYMGDTRTLDVHIRWVRQKIEEDPSNPQRVITIRGMGYRFVSEPE